MTLAEQILADNENVFLELEDFAEVHRIDGVEVNISLDSDRLDKLKASGNTAVDGADMMFFVRSREVKKVNPGGILNFDGKECKVVYWTENKGIASVAIQRRVGR